MYQVMKRSKFLPTTRWIQEWFNWKYNLKLEKFELVELLKLAVEHQLFQIDGKLYEQADGVAMGSPLGPLMANAFMCSIAEKLVERNLMPSLYHRFVYDYITLQSNPLRKKHSFPPSTVCIHHFNSLWN
jgi:hypothetical protein